MAGNEQRNPRVSVVMPVYNDLRFVDASVMSLLRQTYDDFELIIVDDGTGQPEVFSRLAALDTRVRVITCEQNHGNAAALNRGIAGSRGEIIARLDADDFAEPDRLARLVTLLDCDPALGLVGSWAMRVSELGEPVELWRWPVTDLEIRWTILFQSPVCHPSSAYRRDCFDRSGGYNSAMRQSADHDLWWRMLQQCRAQNIPLPLVRVRINPRGLSAGNPTNWRLRTEPLRRRAWASLGVEYDADLIPYLADFISGGSPSDPTMRLQVYRTVLRLLGRFLARQPLPRAEDLAVARQLKSVIVRRVLGDRSIGLVSWAGLLPTCLRLSPAAALAGLRGALAHQYRRLRRLV
jgi:glycosyltransferase involved in cell wall biosynthesis